MDTSLYYLIPALAVATAALVLTVLNRRKSRSELEELRDELAAIRSRLPLIEVLLSGKRSNRIQSARNQLAALGEEYSRASQESGEA